MRKLERVYSLGKIPFYVNLFNIPFNPKGIPDIYDFEIGIDLELGLIIQFPNKGLKHFLQKVYKMGSMLGNPMREEGLGREYANDFFLFIKRIVNNLKGKKILEIGCGNGTLLRKILSDSGRAIGIEPSERKLDKSIPKGIVIRDFYPSGYIKEKFDIIIHYGVLEHAEDPKSFLEAQKRNLKPNGIIFFSIPDCSYYLKSGDISIFFHEHWNYFDFYSLNSLLKSLSFKIINIIKGNVGDTIYVACSPYYGLQRWSGRIKYKRLHDNNYSRKFALSIKKVKDWFEKYRGYERGIGIYCPGRFINYLYKLPDYNDLRFFDDEEEFHGKYYPPFNIKIENFNDFIAGPTGKMLIASRFFAKQIYKKIATKKIIKRKDIVFMEDIISS
jgi:SAM-dependent methyltransferase